MFMVLIFTGELDSSVGVVIGCVSGWFGGLAGFGLRIGFGVGCGSEVDCGWRLLIITIGIFFFFLSSVFVRYGGFTRWRRFLGLSHFCSRCDELI